MTTIQLYRHPFAGHSAPEVFASESIAEWLLSHYGERRPEGITLHVYGGQPSEETDLTGNVEELAKNDRPLYVVLESPGLDPVSWTAVLTSFAVSTAINVVASMLFSPDPQTVPNRTQESPNNQLSDRTNQVRLMERVEDIFGEVRAIPSLLMPTYFKYINNRRVEYGYYSVGRGFYDVSDLRDGDTPISEISGASAVVYKPFNTPNGGTPQLTIGDPIIDHILSVRPSSAMASGGTILKAANQIQLPAGETRYYFRTAGGTAPIGGDAAGDIIYQPEDFRSPNFAAVAEVGQTVTVSGPSAVSNGVAGTRTIIEVHPDYVVLGGASIYPPAVITDIFAVVQVNNDLTDWTDWITLPDLDRTEVWLNIVAPTGLYKDDGAKSSTTVSYEAQIERLDAATLAPTGTVETVSGSLEGATSTERAETIERVTSWVGPVRVRSRRTTLYDYAFTGLVVDEIRWQELYSVAPVNKPHFGNKTTIHTVTIATPGATSVRRRELSCLAARLLPVYNGATFSGVFDGQGGLASGTISKTSRIVDIIAAVTLDPLIGGRTIAEIDLAQIYSVQQALDAWHPEVGQFNYTFDSDSMSYEDTIDAIANAAFCRAYRQNGRIRLAFDTAQTEAVAVFAHHNKRPRSETITRRFASDADYDGVELMYVDPDTESQETIRLPLGGASTQPKKVEVAGIRSFAQAWFRANREYQRLRYERVSVESVVTTDARALLPNRRILLVDNTRFRSWDGEVVGQEGFEVKLSREVEFEAGAPHSIVIQKRDGSLQSISVTPGSAPNKVVLGAAPIEPLVTEPTPEDGKRTAFSFASDSLRAAQAWIVGDVEPTEDAGYYTLRAANYTDQYYAVDLQPVPARDAVIN